MFSSAYRELVQGSAVRTWSCVAHLTRLLWNKFSHLRDPVVSMLYESFGFILAHVNDELVAIGVITPH